ncbi:MAG: hypothetical protein IIT60_05510, partial [Muribaculaceae bacterium]|nr:hypothetical protein [Muribaculaceae bacterium]
VEYGFRIPSAYDNRPLTFDEFEQRVGQLICVSATPAEYELSRASQIAFARNGFFITFVGTNE